MGSCTSHFALPGTHPASFALQTESCDPSLEVLIDVSFGQATLPVAKLGDQRLICARFMTSWEEWSVAEDCVGDALSQKELLTKVAIERGL